MVRHEEYGKSKWSKYVHAKFDSVTEPRDSVEHNRRVLRITFDKLIRSILRA
jgi:hypothetical protein